MKLRKLLYLVLAIVMMLGCMIVTVVAGGEGIYYLYPEYNKTDGTFYENCSSGIKEWKESQCEDFAEVKATDTTWGETGETTWYVANGQIDIANTITIQGDVRLILCDGAKLTITSEDGAGINTYGEGNDFTVYAESESSVPGILTVTGGKKSVNSSEYEAFAGIRSSGGATVTINGGVVTAKSNDASYDAACIGGNVGEDGTHITINGGQVTAVPDNNSEGAGIGGGGYGNDTYTLAGNGEYITINGGTVVAGKGSDDDYEGSAGAGIGGGMQQRIEKTYSYHKGSGSYITINGGDVTAKSQTGAGIGSADCGYTASYITITGGTVYAYGYVGIGGSVNSCCSDGYVSVHDITISGGTVTAVARKGCSGAAIGGGSTTKDNMPVYATVYNITISGSNTVVTANAGNGSVKPGGAGIGGGGYSSAENITIKDGATVIAVGASGAAGIGGGGFHKNGLPADYNSEDTDGYDANDITISGEGTTVIAFGGHGTVGIGAGQMGDAENITITDSAKVYTNGIGASQYNATGITISDGAEVVAATNKTYIAIGAGNNASDITIDNATVTAKTDDTTAIGSKNGTSENIVIKGENTVLTAVSEGGAIRASEGLYVDASLLVVQNYDESLTDDMEVCKDHTLTEDIAEGIGAKVVVIKPRTAYVAQVGTGDNATKYYFVQTAISRAFEEGIGNISGLSQVSGQYWLNQTAVAERELDADNHDDIIFDNTTITMIADSSETVDIPFEYVYFYDPFYLEEMGFEYPVSLKIRSNVTIDLNGHVLNAFFDGETVVSNSGIFNLIDSNPTTEHEFTVDDNGLYAWDEVFTSQIFSQLKTDTDGNYYWDDESETVTIKGGCITGASRERFTDDDGSETTAGVYNKCTFNMTAGTILGNSGTIGGGVYNAATMTVGGTAVIEGNTVYGSDTAQNVYIEEDVKITVSTETPFVTGANIGVTTATKPTEGSPVEFTTNGAKTDEAYFFSDDLNYADKYYNEGSLLDLILGYRVTPKEAVGGTISVGNQKSAYEGETIKVKVTPDEGYELDTLAFSGEGIIATNITDKKSFTMPDKEVVITGTFNQVDYALNGSASITEGGVTFKKGDTTVTTAKYGEEITVVATEVEGYTVTLSSDDVTITNGKFTMPAKAVTITATYTEEESGENTENMDLDTNTSKKFIVNYAFTQKSEEFTDTTKIKIEWTISDISANYKSHKTWDPDTLTWVEVKEDITASNQTATFKITNYSSTDVKANVTFKVEDELKDTYDATNSQFDNNDCTVKTPVVKETTTTYTEASFTEKTQEITATLVFKKDEFAKLDATTQTTKYGTYTVTIVKP